MAPTYTSLILTNGDLTIKMEFLHTKKASLILRALNHKLRQQIIKLIHEAKQMTVSEVYVKLKIEQSVASQHLAVLRRCNIVETNRIGKYIYYTLNYNRLNEINNFVKSLLSYN